MDLPHDGPHSRLINKQIKRHNTHISGVKFVEFLHHDMFYDLKV